MVRLAYRIDWESKKQCVKFEDGWYDIRNYDIGKNKHVILAIKEIQINSNKTVKILDFGFSILPICAENTFIYTGMYQLPIYKNDMTKDTVEELGRSDPFETLLKLSKDINPATGDPFVEVMERTTLMVRLKDNIFEKLYDTPFEINRMNYDFLPTSFLKKYRYDFDKEKVLAKIQGTLGDQYLDKKYDPDEFNEVLRRYTNGAYGIDLEDPDEETT